MPVIKIWCLPKMREEELRSLHKDIVAAAVNIKELGLSSERDITVLFPPDMMRYGLGTEVVIEVTALIDRPERTVEVRQRLASALCVAVRPHVPGAEQIECFVYPFVVGQGYAISAI